LINLRVIIGGYVNRAIVFMYEHIPLPIRIKSEIKYFVYTYLGPLYRKLLFTKYGAGARLNSAYNDNMNMADNNAEHEQKNEVLSIGV